MIREATLDDAVACAELYAPYVERTAITFETEPPTAPERAERIGDALATHTWLVLEHEGRVRGYTYARPFHPRAAYRWSCEVTVFAELGRRRTGAGRALYTALFAQLEARGFHTAVALITLPNDASVGLHRAMGFEHAGTHTEIGYKLGAWHDVTWMQRRLADVGDPPAEPR
ncbi:MAG: N-acetyltransferase family protein [Baekduiaceae bacterium]